ncbi:MAG: hypothetical protein JSU86_14720 [Phycisphaerales bacterium]|nr:MAG: hypothetical protein JSU86_14720 [Phycisphaerales bacterium]
MTGHTRMSPLTALFIGLFGVGAVGIASGTLVVLYGMRIIDTKANEVLGFADNTISKTIDGLPALFDSLPRAVEELLSDRRAPEYAANLDVAADFVVDERSKGRRPVLTITNKGSEVVSFLAVRVAALDTRRLPIREWTEVVATPIALEDGDWRGPLFPGDTRYAVVSSSWRTVPADRAEQVIPAVEISDIRIWQPSEGL